MRRQRDQDSRYRASQPAADEDHYVRARTRIRLQERAAEQGAERACGHSRDDPALQQESPDPVRRAAAVEPHQKRRRDDSGGDQQGQQSASDQADGNAHTDENEDHHAKDESDNTHAPRMPLIDGAVKARS